MRRRSRMSPARKLACVVLAVAVVASVVYATGAFTSTTASRSADIEVAGHGSAFLSLQPSEGPNGKFASYGPMGALQVKIGGAGLQSAATGVNPDSKTVFKNVFTITNNGSQPVAIWITGHSKAVTFRAKSTGILIEGQGNSRPLPVGETLHVGFVIDTRGGGVQPGTNLLKSVTIHTNANNKAVSEARENTRKSGSGGSTGSGTGGNGGGNGNGGTQAGNGGGGGNDGPGWPGDESEGDNGSDGSDDSSRDGNSNSGSGDSADESSDSDDGTSATEVIGTVVKAAKALLIGFLAGDAGMPGGIYTAKEASSPLYLIGMLLNAVAPGPLDMVADLRDLVAKAVSGKLLSLGALFNAIGLLPVFGAIDDVRDLGKTVQNWMSAFPKKADDITKIVSNAFIKYLPKGAGAKVLGLVSDAPVSKLTDADIPVEDIIKYSDEGVDFQKVLELRRKGVSPEDIRGLVDDDIDLGLANRLVDEGMNAKRIRFRLGDGAQKAISDLRGPEGFSRTEIVDLIDEGADLKKARKLLRSQEMSPGDIKDLVRKDISLGAASTLRKMHVPSRYVKPFLTGVKRLENINKITVKGPDSISNKELRWIRKKIAGEHKIINKKTIAIAAAANQIRSWKKETQNSRSKKRGLSDGQYRRI